MDKIIMGGVEFKFNNLYKGGVETDELGLMFYDNGEVTYVEMGKITVVNWRAFYGCSKLNTVILKRLRVIGEEAFAYCGLKTIDITNVVSIGDGCFKGSKLESISLNDEITEIPTEAFRECEMLKTIKLPSNLEIIGQRAFYRVYDVKIELPSTIKSIAAEAFYLSGTGEINISTEVLIGDRAFYGSYFSKIVIKKITNITEQLFRSCSFITAEFESAEMIGKEAFGYCRELTNIYMPKITKIGDYAFSNCKKLNITSLPDTLKEIGIGAFTSCTQLSLTSLPNTITKMGLGAFALTSIAIKQLPLSMNRLEDQVFSYCYSLTELTLGGKGYPMEYITPFFQSGDDYTKYTLGSFYDCPNLKKLTIYTTGGQALAGAPWGATNAVITYLPA